jgi:hypothetical protein
VRVLLDECVPRRLANAFGEEHAVDTVARMGWAGTTNGELLQLATANGFEAFVTVDVNLRVAPDSLLRVLVLRSGSNRLEITVAANAQRARSTCSGPAWPH